MNFTDECGLLLERFLQELNPFRDLLLPETEAASFAEEERPLDRFPQLWCGRFCDKERNLREAKRDDPVDRLKEKRELAQGLLRWCELWPALEELL